MSQPLISIITITFNAAKVLKTTMQSVAEQTWRDFEHIIIDGASSDATLEIARSYPMTRILSEPDRGLYDAMNKGLRMARGKYVIFLNAGDTFRSSDVLDKYARRALKGDDIIYADTMVVDDTGQDIAPRHHTAPKVLTQQSFSKGMLVCHQAFMVKKDLAPDYDLSYRFSADYDWTIRCINRSNPSKNTNLGIYAINYLNDGLTDKNKMKSLRERYNVMKTHYGAVPTLLHHIKLVSVLPFKRLRKIFHICILAIIALGLLAACDDNPNNKWTLPTKELQSLDQAIANSARYELQAKTMVDSMKHVIDHHGLSPSEHLKTLIRIARFYCPRDADSALVYADLARTFSERHHIDDPDYSLAFLSIEAQAAGGFFSGALMQYDSIRPRDLSEKDRLKYWQTGRRLYTNLCNYTGEGNLYYDRYEQHYIECTDSLLAHLPEDNMSRWFILAEKMMAAGKGQNARAGLEEIMSRYEPGENLYGMAAFQLAQTYRTDDPTRYAALLAEAAESDIRGAIKDGFALPMLGTWLYSEGYYSRAFEYMNFALNDAFRGNARMRLVDISRLIPEIDEAYRKYISQRNNEIASYAVMLSVLLIALIAVIVYLIKEIKKRRMAHTALASTSKIKDRYIRDFINLCSAYSEKYDSLSKTVIRKINSGQTQELLKIVKYGKNPEAENEEFYHTIDGVVLSLYPDFIERINELLVENMRFDIPENSDSLNPELRIYGFVRLGVAESAKIARILNYSINTVYAYRNRMRNRAISRDTFDTDVMSIGTEDIPDDILS